MEGMKIGRTIAVLIVILLLISFGWHLIQINHIHLEAQYGEGIEAVFHDDDRKWWILFLAFLFALSFAKILPKVNTVMREIKVSIPETPLFIDALALAFQKGNIHSKVYFY